jgi:hypothetical protein
MCLALYDRTPRLSGRGGARLGEDVGTADPRCLLRRGAVEARAEVDFVGGDGARYRSVWAVRRARDRADGRLQAQTLELHEIDGGVIHAGQKTDVLARTERALVRQRLVRTVVWVLAVLLPVLVGVSRLYRGMHFPTDVVAGAALACGALTCSLLAVRSMTAAARDRERSTASPPHAASRTEVGP